MFLMLTKDEVVKAGVLHFVQNDWKNANGSKVLHLRQRLFTVLRVTQ